MLGEGGLSLRREDVIIPWNATHGEGLMILSGDWVQAVMAVGALGVLTLAFALLVGRWIDGQSNSVVDEPRKERRARRNDR